MRSYLLVILFVLPIVADGAPAGEALTHRVAAEQVVLSFITRNGNGNNLYLDNVSAGKQSAQDVAIVSLPNVSRDTSYVVGGSTLVVAPRVGILNAGTGNITSSFTVTLTSSPGTYSSTKTIASMTRREFREVVFDNLTITPGTPLNLKAAASMAADQNRSNDTLKQYSIFFAGVGRKVLLEEATNTSCAPCAANNPSLDAFIAAKFDSLVPVKYHAWWPSSADPMYVANISENSTRINYYGINGVPCSIFDGIVQAALPFSTSANLQGPLSARLGKGTPFGLSLVESRVAGDSIVAGITVNVTAPVRAGSYRLRVWAVERHVSYASAPGNNGEKDFYDVFRKAVSSATGTLVPTALGTYSFQFRFKRASDWVDAQLYTVAFIQDDLSKEVMNAAKGRTQLLAQSAPLAVESASPAMRPVPRPQSFQAADADAPPSGPTGVLTTFNTEVFEGSFPPPNWRLVNPDKGLTFEQTKTCNGPSFGGSSAVKMDFYDYGGSGKMDTLYSCAFTGLSGTDSVGFDWAYAKYTGYNDRLTVKLSIDGGLTFPVTIFDRDTLTLPTAPSTYSPFVPTSGQWMRFAYPLTGLVAVPLPAGDIPLRYELAQNYPNPFNPATTISFVLASAGRVSLRVYDLLGREVRNLVEEDLPAGTHSVALDAQGMSSGPYFYILKANGFVSARTMMLIK